MPWARRVELCVRCCGVAQRRATTPAQQTTAGSAGRRHAEKRQEQRPSLAGGKSQSVRSVAHGVPPARRSLKQQAGGESPHGGASQRRVGKFSSPVRAGLAMRRQVGLRRANGAATVAHMEWLARGIAHRVGSSGFTPGDATRHMGEPQQGQLLRFAHGGSSRPGSKPSRRQAAGGGRVPWGAACTVHRTRQTARSASRAPPSRRRKARIKKRSG